MDAYDRKFAEMQKYIPFLEAMIERLQKVKDKSREAQLQKMQSLHGILSNSKRKLKIETLQRCEEVLQKLHNKVEKGNASGLNFPQKKSEDPLCQSTDSGEVAGAAKPEKLTKSSEKIERSGEPVEKNNKSSKSPENLTKSPEKIEPAETIERLKKAPENVEKSAKSLDKVEKSTKPAEKVEKPTKPTEKVTKPLEKNEKTAKVSEKSEKTGKPAEKIEKTTKLSESIEKTAKLSEKIEKSTKSSEKVEKTTKPQEKIEKTKKPSEKIDKTTKPLEKIGKSPNPSDKIERTQKLSNKIEKSSKPSDKIDNPTKTLEKITNCLKLVEKIEKSPKPLEKIDKFAVTSDKIDKSPKPLQKIDITPKPPEKTDTSSKHSITSLGQKKSEPTEKSLNPGQSGKLSRRKMETPSSPTPPGTPDYVPRSVPIIIPTERENNYNLSKPSSPDQGDTLGLVKAPIIIPTERKEVLTSKSCPKTDSNLIEWEMLEESQKQSAKSRKTTSWQPIIATGHDVASAAKLIGNSLPQKMVSENRPHIPMAPRHIPTVPVPSLDGSRRLYSILEKSRLGSLNLEPMKLDSRPESPVNVPEVRLKSPDPEIMFPRSRITSPRIKENIATPKISPKPTTPLLVSPPPVLTEPPLSIEDLAELLCDAGDNSKGERRKDFEEARKGVWERLSEEVNKVIGKDTSAGKLPGSPSKDPRTARSHLLTQEDIDRESERRWEEIDKHIVKMTTRKCLTNNVATPPLSVRLDALKSMDNSRVPPMPQAPPPPNLSSPDKPAEHRDRPLSPSGQTFHKDKEVDKEPRYADNYERHPRQNRDQHEQPGDEQREKGSFSHFRFNEGDSVNHGNQEAASSRNDDSARNPLFQRRNQMNVQNENAPVGAVIGSRRENMEYFNRPVGPQSGRGPLLQSPVTPDFANNSQWGPSVGYSGPVHVAQNSVPNPHQWPISNPTHQDMWQHIPAANSSMEPHLNQFPNHNPTIRPLMSPTIRPQTLNVDGGGFRDDMSCNNMNMIPPSGYPVASQYRNFQAYDTTYDGTYDANYDATYDESYDRSYDNSYDCSAEFSHGRQNWDAPSSARINENPAYRRENEIPRGRPSTDGPNCRPGTPSLYARPGTPSLWGRDRDRSDREWPRRGRGRDRYYNDRGRGESRGGYSRDNRREDRDNNRNRYIWDARNVSERDPRVRQEQRSQSPPQPREPAAATTTSVRDPRLAKDVQSPTEKGPKDSPTAAPLNERDPRKRNSCDSKEPRKSSPQPLMRKPREKPRPPRSESRNRRAHETENNALSAVDKSSKEKMQSPLESLYGVIDTKAKTGQGYGLQKFKIPKIRRPDPPPLLPPPAAAVRPPSPAKHVEERQTVQEKSGITDKDEDEREKESPVDRRKKKTNTKVNVEHEREAHKKRNKSKAKKEQKEEKEVKVEKEAKEVKEEVQHETETGSKQNKVNEDVDERMKETSSHQNKNELKEHAEDVVNVTAETTVKQDDSKPDVQESAQDTDKTKDDKPDVKTDEIKRQSGEPIVLSEKQFSEAPPSEHVEGAAEAETPKYKEEVTQEWIEALIRKSFEFGEGKKLFEQAKLLEKLGKALQAKKFKKIKRIIDSDSESSSSKDEEDTVEPKKVLGKKKRRVIMSDSSDEEMLADRMSLLKESSEKEEEEEEEGALDGKKSKAESEQEAEDKNDKNTAFNKTEDQDSVRIENETKVEKSSRAESRTCATKKLDDRSRVSPKKDEEPIEEPVTEINDEAEEAKNDGTISEFEEPSEEKEKPKPKKTKRRNSLEMLQEDIREMFISQGVVTATGHRMCRLIKEGQSNLNNTVQNLPNVSTDTKKSSNASDESEFEERIRPKSRARRRKSQRTTRMTSKEYVDSSDSEGDQPLALRTESSLRSESPKTDDPEPSRTEESEEVLSLRRSKRVPRVLVEKTDMSKIDSSKLMFDSSSDESFNIDVSELTAAVDISLHPEAQAPGEPRVPGTPVLSKNGQQSVVNRKKSASKKKQPPKTSEERPDDNMSLTDEGSVTSDISMASSIGKKTTRSLSKTQLNMNEELLSNVLVGLVPQKKTSVDKESDADEEELDSTATTVEEAAKPAPVSKKKKKKKFSWQQGYVSKKRRKKPSSSIYPAPVASESEYPDANVDLEKSLENSADSEKLLPEDSSAPAVNGDDHPQENDEDDDDELPDDPEIFLSDAKEREIETEYAAVDDAELPSPKFKKMKRVTEIDEQEDADAKEKEDKDVDGNQPKTKEVSPPQESWSVDKLLKYAWVGMQRYKCMYCPFMGKNIVHHYTLGHPDKEVVISRLTPDAMKLAHQESQDDASRDDSKDARKYYCRFCPSIDTSVETFYEHCTTHTGEYRHKCKCCPYQSVVKSSIKSHYYKVCRKLANSVSVAITEDKIPEGDRVFGYVCSICNFVQLKMSSMEKHVEQHQMSHPDVQIQKIDMSSASRADEDEAADEEQPEAETAVAADNEEENEDNEEVEEVEEEVSEEKKDKEEEAKKKDKDEVEEEDNEEEVKEAEEAVTSKEAECKSPIETVEEIDKPIEEAVTPEQENNVEEVVDKPSENGDPEVETDSSTSAENAIDKATSDLSEKEESKSTEESSKAQEEDPEEAEETETELVEDVAKQPTPDPPPATGNMSAFVCPPDLDNKEEEIQIERQKKMQEIVDNIGIRVDKEASRRVLSIADKLRNIMDTDLRAESSQEPADGPEGGTSLTTMSSQSSLEVNLSSLGSSQVSNDQVNNPSDSSMEVNCSSISPDPGAPNLEEASQGSANNEAKIKDPLTTVNDSETETSDNETMGEPAVAYESDSSTEQSEFELPTDVNSLLQETTSIGSPAAQGLMMTTIQRLAAQLQGAKSATTVVEEVGVKKVIPEPPGVVPLSVAKRLYGSFQEQRKEIQENSAPKNFIRLRRLSGDMLSVPSQSAEGEEEAPVTSGADGNHSDLAAEVLRTDTDVLQTDADVLQTDAEEECSFLKIENVVSLAPTGDDAEDESPIISDIRKAVETSPAKSKRSLLKNSPIILKRLSRSVLNAQLLGKLNPTSDCIPESVKLIPIKSISSSSQNPPSSQVTDFIRIAPKPNIRIHPDPSKPLFTASSPKTIPSPSPSSKTEAFAKPSVKTSPASNQAQTKLKPKTVALPLPLPASSFKIIKLRKSASFLKHKEYIGQTVAMKLKTADAYSAMLKPEKLCHLYKCMSRDCRYTTNSVLNYKYHYEEHLCDAKVKGTTPPLRCQNCAYCCEVLDDWNEMKKHVIEWHGHCRYQCGYCFYRAYTQSYVELHQAISHPDQPFKVLLTKAISNHVPSDFLDRRNCVPPFICQQECGKCFFIPEAFISHLKTKHGPILSMYKCYMCPASCLKPEQLVSHYKLHGIFKYQCMFCLNGSDTPWELHNHLSHFHPALSPLIIERTLPHPPLKNKDVLDQLLVRNVDDGYKASNLVIDTSEESETSWRLDDNRCTSSPITAETPASPKPPAPASSPKRERNDPPKKMLPSPEEFPTPEKRRSTCSEDDETLGTQIHIPETENFDESSFELRIDSSPEKLSPQKPSFQEPKESSSPNEALILVNERDKSDEQRKLVSKQILQEPELLLRYTNEEAKTVVENAVDPLGPLENLLSDVDKSTVPKLSENDPELGNEDSDIEILEDRVASPQKLKVSSELDPKLQERKLSIDCSSADNSDLNSSEMLKNNDVPLSLDDIRHTGFAGTELFRCGYENCSFAAASSEHLREHLKVCGALGEVRNLSCVHCNKRFMKAGFLLEHLKQHGLKRFGCSMCKMRCATPFQAMHHMKVKHKFPHSKLVPADPKNPSAEALFVVQAVHRGPGEKVKGKKRLLTKQADKDFERMMDVEKTSFNPEEVESLPRQAIYNREVLCAVCPYTTKVRTNMIRHLQLHAKDETVPETGPVNPVPCLDKKERMFDKMVNLASSSHQNGRMGGRAKEPEVESCSDESMPKFVPEYKRYVCGVTDCKYQTVDETMLRCHLKALHSDEPYFRCPHCPPPLPENESQNVAFDKMGVHLKMHDTRLYKCSHCNHHHYHRHIVERHLTDKHPDQRPYVRVIREPDAPEPGQPVQEDAEEEGPDPDGNNWRCNLCDYKCIYKAEMISHASTLHDEKSQFKCTECPYKTTGKITFEQHFLARHPGVAQIKYDMVYQRLKGAPKRAVAPAEVPEPAAGLDEPFDTTPLWRRDMPRVRHIRGILLEEEEEATSSESPVKLGKRKSDTDLCPKPAKLKPGRASANLDERPRAAKLSESLIKKLHGPDDPESENAEESLEDSAAGTSFSEEFSELSDSDMGQFGPYGKPNGVMYVCTLCSQFETKYKHDMRDHLYRELKYMRWHCRECGFLSVNRNALLKHFVKQHPGEHPDHEPLTPDNSIEDWVSTLLKKQTSIMRGSSSKPQAGKKESVQASAPAKKSLKESRPVLQSTLKTTEDSTKTVDLTQAITSLQEKEDMGLEGDMDDDSRDDDGLIIDLKEDSIEEMEAQEEKMAPEKAPVLKKEEKSLICKHCGMKFARWRGFKLHVQLIHLKRLGFLCPYCDRSTNSEPRMRQHIHAKHPHHPERIVHNPKAGGQLSDEFWEKEYGLICPKKSPGKKRKRVSSTEEAGKAGDDPVTQEVCSICGFTAMNYTGLKAHMRIHAVRNTLKCVYCTFSAAEDTEVLQHWELNHSQFPYKVEELALPGPSGQKAQAGPQVLQKNYGKEIVGGRFAKPPQLKLMYCCYYCTLRSKDLSTVRTHWQMVHKELKPGNGDSLTLTGCKSGLPFRYKEAQVAVPPPQKPMKCGYCDKTGPKPTLKAHIRKKHSDRPALFFDIPEAVPDGWTCQWCNEFCDTELKMQHHQTMFHSHLPLHFKKQENGESQRGYTCPQCPFSAPSISTMKKHVVKHIKLFKCKHCDEAFASHTIVNAHNSTEHPELDVKIESISNYDDQVEALMTRVTWNVAEEPKPTPGKIAVAKKSTATPTVRLTPSPTKIRSVARKSTNPLPRYPAGVSFVVEQEDSDKETSAPTGEGYTFYGLPRPPVDLGRLSTSMVVGGHSMKVNCTTLSQLLNINPRVFVKDLKYDLDH